MNKETKIGISLIILVITIIVIIILAGSILLSLSENNPIESANKATFLSDVSAFKEQLEMYKVNEYTVKMGKYEPSSLQADEGSLVYTGQPDTEEEKLKTIYTAIPSLERVIKYQGKFAIEDGELVFLGNETNEILWSENLGVQHVTREPKVIIVPTGDSVISSGEDMIYTIYFSSKVNITNINLVDEVELIDENNLSVDIPKSDIIIGEIVGTNTKKQVIVTVKTSNLIYGKYKLKVNAGVITNQNDLLNMEESISLTSVEILDNVPPENPLISATPAIPTTENVTVTITYLGDTIEKLYSFTGEEGTWLNYTSPIVVTENNITVWAKGKDEFNNESGASTLTISNIDRIGPTVIFGTNGGNDISQVSTTVNLSDSNGIKTSSLQYVWDTQNVTAPTIGWTTFTNGVTLTKSGDGVYYLWIKGNDNLGNGVIEKSNLFKIEDQTIVIGTVQTENKTFSGETTGFSYNNPVIPAGFMAANTREANWNNLSTDWNKGLVILDTYGNEFVWVPINGATAYKKWCVSEYIPPAMSTADLGYDTNGYVYDSSLPSSYLESDITTTYKCFYIARYESAFDYNEGAIRVASKKSLDKTSTDWSATRDLAHDGYLWNFITYSEARNYSQNMTTSYNYDITKCGTSLVTGKQWDSIMAWLKNTAKDVTISNKWGNYTSAISPANVSRIW